MEISKARIKSYLGTFRQNILRRARRTLLVLPFFLLAAGIGLCIFSGVRIHQIKASQQSQLAAEYWSGDSGKSYRQISCFAIGQTQPTGGPQLYLSTAVSLNKPEIESIRANLDSIVLAASASVEDSKKGNSNAGKTVPQEDSARLWIDSYSAEADSTVVREATKLKPEISAEVTLTGVSGDYFLFHPLRLLDGAFLSDDTLDSRKIVLDKELAFKLFGSYKAVGSEVKILGREYTVVGVVQHAETKIDKASAGDLLRAYILFDELAFLSSPGEPQSALSLSIDSSTQGEIDSSTLAILCYEVVLPNKIKGIAMQNLKSSMETAGKVEKNFLFTDNTSRFSLPRLYDTIFPIGENDLKRRQYQLPFWEISAETAESVSVFWWITGMAGLYSIITSGLALYVGTHKNKGFRV